VDLAFTFRALQEDSRNFLLTCHTGARKGLVCTAGDVVLLRKAILAKLACSTAVVLGNLISIISRFACAGCLVEASLALLTRDTY
jgi:hypothetical protein